MEKMIPVTGIKLELSQVQKGNWTRVNRNNPKSIIDYVLMTKSMDKKQK